MENSIFQPEKPKENVKSTNIFQKIPLVKLPCAKKSRGEVFVYDL
jgi:hypothetical protein